ncbi:MAG: response regulator [Patescibacteria group bacterium]|nr:response regulator [Patescibacteria group bacterium]
MNHDRIAIVIDDDKDTREVISELLELNKIQVVGNGNDGKEAVTLYQKLRPKFVFLDVMMPNYDGLYALEQIKKIDSEAKIIMITGDITEETREKVNMLNADAVFYKPVEIGKLVEYVDRLCNSRNITQSYT